ncbi:MAG: hypothetical protein JOZ41_07485, partial [Chloroflexi bacterium]|nr:hypothetical protein [Chloroflexota bacterium]
MSEVLDSRQVDDSVERFASAAALRAAHTELLKRYRASADPHEMLAEVEGFIRKGSATGTSLDADNDRWAAQSLLDYWTAILYRVGHEPLDGTLAEFDPTQAPELDDADPPYIGLEAFREEDHSRFFGRQRLVEEWIGRLADSRLLAVVGSSGSGKSSLVRGGVLPALRAGGVPGSERWRYYPPVVPGSEPLTGLVRLFQPPDSAPEWVEQQVRELRRDPLQLARVVGAGGEEPVVLVVDQFEEVFTLCSDEEARQAFAASLVGLAQAPGPRHTVILTLRSDFEAQVVQLRALEPLFGQIQARVTPLNAVELREAIERPAERVGLKVEQGVVDQLIKEILGEPAGLPLLQFALLKLWENRERNRVTRETYQRLGGARRALACSADEVYEGLFEDQVTARCILLRMVRPGEGLEVTSSRVRRDRLHETCGASDRVDHVLDRLRQARLIRRTAGDAPGADQFEVAHEALIRNWPRLVGWLDEERIALRQRLRLTSSAEQWQAKGRDPGALLRGSLLKDARRYTDLGPLEREFVAASQAEDERVKRERAEARRREEEQERALLLVQERAHAERERAEKAELARQVAEAKQREEEQRRALLLEQERTRAEKAEYARRVQENATRRLRRLAAVLLFFLAVAVLSGALAVRFYLNVRDDTSIATSRELAASAQAQVPADPELSVLLAMEAVSTWDTPQAQAALRQALFASRVRAVMRGPEKMAGAAFSPGGRLVVTADADGAARVWDTGTGKLLHVLRGHAGRVTHVAFSPDGRQIVTAGDDGTAHIWDTRRWKTIFVLQGHHDVVNDAAYSPDGRLIVTASNDGTALVWDARTGKPLHSLRGHGDVVNTAEFSPDGRFIVTASHDGTVEVWDGHRGAALYALGDKRISGLRTGPSKAGVTGGAGLYSLAGGVSPVNDAVFSPDGRLIVTAGDDDTARIWRAGTGRLLQVLTGHTGPVLRAVFSPDSRLVATASADDTARLWDVGTGKVRHVLIQHLDRVIAVAFSPDGSLLATASDDSTAAVWDASTGSLITVLNGHEDPLTSVAFSPDGRRLASA